MAGRLTPRAAPHVEEPRLENDAIWSGSQRAPIVHRGSLASIGEGPDNALWVLVHDPLRRPRGRDPGTFVDTVDLSYEVNGLVRVLERRVARDTLERLVADLTGSSESITGTLTRASHIPAGNYGGLVVTSVDGHYQVQASGLAARSLADMQPIDDGTWLVLAGEESQLRRVLVNRIMPLHHRLAWEACRHGAQILIVVGGALALLSLRQPLLVPLAFLAAMGLIFFHLRRGWFIGKCHSTLVKPYIDRTMPTRTQTRKLARQRLRAARNR